MALTLGSVSVSADGTVSGSGAALRLYQKRAAAAAKIKQGIALFANADAEWMVEEITGFAEAKIEASVAGDGLQTQADPIQPTTRPAADKFLPIV